MTDDNGLAEALAAAKAKDDEHKRKIENWRTEVRRQIELAVPGIREQIEGLMEPDPRVPADVRAAIQALVAMVATQSVATALQHQILMGAIIARSPEEEQHRTMASLNDMSMVAAEESSTIMDLLLP